MSKTEKHSFLMPRDYIYHQTGFIFKYILTYLHINRHRSSRF